MAYSYQIYTATTSQTDFAIPFNYIKEAHIKVYVNYVDTSFTFAPNKTTARLASAPGNGVRVEVRRITPLDNVLVDYADGSTLTATDLDTSNLQHQYNAQEADDNINQGVAIDPATGQPTLNNQRLTNVTDPSAAQDAATKNYVDTTTQPVDAELTELATMASATASSLADLTQAEVQILDGATVTTTELNLLDGVTATTAEINYVDGVTSNVQTQLNAKQPLDAELTELATMSSDTAAALADLTQAEVQLVDGATLSTTELNYVDGVTSAIQTQIDGKQPLDADLTSLSSCQSGSAVNLALLTSGEVAVLDGATLSTNELNTLTGITATTAELNKLDGVTSTAGNLNVVSGMTKATSLTSNSDTELPTSKAVADHVTSVVNALGGFVAINGPTNFPATQPAQGVVVSIKDVGSGFTTSSNEITITNGAGTNKNVRITGFPSEYAAATLVDDTGLQVTSDITNSTSGTPAVHRYVYHKQLAKESDVKALSDDINDFNERYRVSNGAPSGTDHPGDLYYDTGSDKMLVRNAANNAWEEVQSIGSFNFNTLSSYNGTGGNSAAFNGIAYRFVLSNPPSFAQQLICSINGVVQKPNANTSQPSEGFALDGSSIIFSDPPAQNAPFFIITLGSTVNIGTVSDGTVTEAKLSVGNDPSNGKFLQAQSGQTGGLFWADAGDSDKIEEGNTSVECTDTGSDGAIKFTVDGTEQFRVGPLNTVNLDDTVLTFGAGLGGGGSSGFAFYPNNNSFGLRDSTAFKIKKIDAGAGEDIAKFTPDGGVELYFDNAKKFETLTGGATITGVCTATSFSGDGSALTGIASTSLNGCGYQNDQTISAGTYSIAANKGMHSVGPITNNGTVTVSGTWVIS